MSSDVINYISQGIYKTRCNFCNLASFKDWLLVQVRDIHSREMHKKLVELTNSLKAPVDAVGQREALKLLIARDLEAALKNIPLDQTKYEEKEIWAHFETLKKVFDEEFKINCEDVELFIVDKFPAPFDTMFWDAAFFEETERDAFGIIPGIYLRKDKISPFYTSYRMAHEFVHVIAGRLGVNVPTGLARGLEDGICDLVGSLFLGSHVLGSDLCLNLAIYDRNGFWPEKQFWELYRENLQQAFICYKHVGLNGIVDTIKRGRKGIKEAEKLCLAGRYGEISSVKGYWISGLDEICDFLIGMPRSLVVSPLARYIAELVKPDSDIEQLITDNNLLETDAKGALQELQERVYLIVVTPDRKKVQYDDSKLYIDTGALRYEIPIGE